jgi:tRNA (cytidine/uridine-2'-O-)-methyltransferase
LGFSIDEKAVRRAGLDYWHLVRVTQHRSWTAFERTFDADCRLFLFTGKASRSFLDVSYQPGDYLVFGKESSGLPERLLTEHQNDLVGIPTLGQVRSLNLANAVALGVYEALRQTGQLEQASLRTVPLSEPGD